MVDSKVTKRLNNCLKAMKQKTQQANLLVMGLDNAGKTTILKTITEESITHLSPTQGFTIRNVAVEGVNLNAIDVGGSKSFRQFLSSYFQQANAIIYVIDAADQKRLIESGAELTELVKDKELAGIPLLILANKQDLVSAADSDEIAKKLSLSHINNRVWAIIECSARQNEGVAEGLEWIANEVAKQK